MHMAYPCFCSLSLSFLCSRRHRHNSLSSVDLPLRPSIGEVPHPRLLPSFARSLFFPCRVSSVCVSSQALVCLRRCHLIVPSHHPHSIHALLAPGVSLARGNATLDSPCWTIQPLPPCSSHIQSEQTQPCKPSPSQANHPNSTLNP